jgi:hypothetical protein
MQNQLGAQIILWFISVVLVVSSCSTSTSVPSPTNMLQPTATETLVPTATPTATRTPRPTVTPNMSATQKAEEFQADVQSYFDQGYLKTMNGKVYMFADFEDEWAQLQWYRRFPLNGSAASYSFSDFAFSAHFKWSSAYRNADLSGCGVAFAEQINDDHYAVFLDRSKVLFAQTDYYYNLFGPTRGTGRVDFGNPFDKPAEADFTLIVRDNSAFVLVNDELVGEYSLAQSRSVRGRLKLALISGTNKDYGTRCEITNIHLFVPNSQE